MLIKVKGKLNEILYSGEEADNILINADDGSRVVVTIKRTKEVYNKLIEGLTIDLYCTLRVKAKVKKDKTFYNNIIYVEGEFKEERDKKEIELPKLME